MTRQTILENLNLLNYFSNQKVKRVAHNYDILQKISSFY